MDEAIIGKCPLLKAGKNFLGQNNLAVIAVALVLIIGGIIFLQGLKSNPSSQGNAQGELLKIDKSGYAKAPELVGISGYINTGPKISIASLKGKVVLVDFWTFSCINCIRTLPYLTSWDEKYRDKGLVIVGVHSPEFDFEKDYNNVVEAVRGHNIKYPVIQDNDFATWRAYNNHFWPHKFLIDAEGYIRYDHIGEGSYNETEMKILELLKERDSALEVEMPSGGGAPVQAPDFSRIGTPEIYLGSNFARTPLGNEEGFALTGPVDYYFPDSFGPNLAYFSGTWKTEADYSGLLSDSGKVALIYTAKTVNIVASSPQGSELRVFIDGAEAGGLSVGGEKLYVLNSGADYSQKTLEFEISGKGFRIYTFTFG